MTDNRDVEAAWAYHNGTKHSYQSVRTGPQGLDFSNQPLPFKIYTTLEAIPLPSDAAPPAMPALLAIAASPSPSRSSRILDLGALAQLLHLGGGITRRRKMDGWEFQFRAASCTGALYHIELYLVCGELPGLAAGVYHFGVHDSSLRQLRRGDYRSVLVGATAGEPSVASAPAVIIGTSTFWRNAWKYRARAYRHAFWDSGTILANLLAAAAGMALPARIVVGFADAAVNGLLGLDSDREASLALVPVGSGSPASTEEPCAVEPVHFETMPLSRVEIDYPSIRAMHAASSLGTGEEAARWRGRGPSGDPPPAASGTLSLRPLGDPDLPTDSVTEVIRRRGSSRRFDSTAMTLPQLSTMLDRATRGIPADFLAPEGATLVTPYVIVHAVDGLAPGAYVYHRREKALELIREGHFRNEAGYLGLEQELPAQAGANVYCLVNLDTVLARFGNRGYRAAQLEGGIIGGKLYLSAYAQHLGATGLTFFDDEVTAFFSPHASGKSVMFLTALGHPARRRHGN